MADLSAYRQAQAERARWEDSVLAAEAALRESFPDGPAAGAYDPIFTPVARYLAARGVTLQLIASLAQDGPYGRHFGQLAEHLAAERGDVFSMTPVLAASTPEPEPCALPCADLAAVPELEAER